MTKIVRLAKPSDAKSAATIDPALRGGVVSIGNFDGVHVGHASLLAKVTELAGATRPTIAVVFDPHPAAILRPDRVPPRLTWIERRAELLDRLDIDYLVVCQTTREFLNLTAEAFFQWLIVDQLDAKAIVEGPNFFFGKGRGGNTDTLRELCQASGIDCCIVDANIADDQMISSTRIRDQLISGSLDQANDWLEVPYRIRGRVIQGEQRGRTIGFPTANLAEIDVVLPRDGVYGGVAWVAGAPFDAAIHIGPNPTFDDDQNRKVEVHLLDYDDDIYGQLMMVDFVTFVRDIARFNSAEQLSQQLNQDIAAVRARLGKHRSKHRGDAGNDD